MFLKLRQYLGFLVAYGFNRFNTNYHLKDSTLPELVALLFLMNNYRYHNDQCVLISEIIIDRFQAITKTDKLLGFFPNTLPNVIQCLTTQIFVAEQEMEKDLPIGQFHPTESELALVTNQFVSTFFKSEV